MGACIGVAFAGLAAGQNSFIRSLTLQADSCQQVCSP
jgi:hypothetical protein